MLVAAQDLHCSVPVGSFIFGLWGCQLQQVRSSPLTRGSSPGPTRWELGVLATGLPGKSPRRVAFRYLMTLGPSVYQTVIPPKGEAMER